MPRLKLQRFQQNAEAPNVVERGKPLYETIKGRWHTDYFRNDHPIVLELACGKGEYTVGLAQAYPQKNFIGIDIKGERIARGSQQALERGLANVAFVRTDIRYLAEFFDEGEISEIWITFPDPHPGTRRNKHRLTHPRFLHLYKQLLIDGGTLHLKTDSRELFEYSLQTLIDESFHTILFTNDLYNSQLYNIHNYIHTTYEQIFYNLGFTINYISCKL
jgi:tRNA (guanine-N7-)-methyltransferase